MDEITHTEIMTEIRVIATKQDRLIEDVSGVKKSLDENSGRLNAIEKWADSHDAVVRFVKWGLAITVGFGSLGLAFVKFWKTS